MDKVRIGIIGVGGIANGVHIPGIEKSTNGVVTAICDIDEKALKKTGDKLGLPENRRFKDHMDLINCPDVDAVEICTPNYLHVPFAVDAIKAGKPINVEKPLSISMEEAEPIRKALDENFVPNMMCFSYRFKPAVRYAKWILEKGLLGDIVSVNVEYLKSSAFMQGRRLDWRFVKKYAGTGVLGDLGVHLVDMAEFLTGKITDVAADCEIVVKKRKYLDSEEYGDVETDDYCSFLAKIEGGIKGTFMITRCALGNANTIKFDVYGKKGVLSFDLNHDDILNVCVGEIDLKSESLHTVKVPREFYITQEQMFVDMVMGKECQYLPTVNDGLRLQSILDSLLTSDVEKRWVKIPE